MYFHIGFFYVLGDGYLVPHDGHVIYSPPFFLGFFSLVSFFIIRRVNSV